MLLHAIAAFAMMGDRSQPDQGSGTPAASAGGPVALKSPHKPGRRNAKRSCGRLGAGHGETAAWYGA